MFTLVTRIDDGLWTVDPAPYLTRRKAEDALWVVKQQAAATGHVVSHQIVWS